MINKRTIDLKAWWGLLAVAVTALGCFPGCVDQGPHSSAESSPLATRDWTLSQGSVLSATILETVIEEETSLTSLQVRHTTRSNDELPVQKLEMRFVKDGIAGDWVEISAAAAEDNGSGTVQTFEMGFSAPSPWAMDFRVTLEGKPPEEFLGWIVNLDE